MSFDASTLVRIAEVAAIGAGVYFGYQLIVKPAAAVGNAVGDAVKNTYEAGKKTWEAANGVCRAVHLCKPSTAPPNRHDENWTDEQKLRAQSLDRLVAEGKYLTQYEGLYYNGTTKMFEFHGVSVKAANATDAMHRLQGGGHT